MEFVFQRNYDNRIENLTHAVHIGREGVEYSHQKQKLNDLLEKFNESNPPDTTVAFFNVCEKFNENFDITVNEKNVEINNEYELPKDLIKLVSLNILIVFNSYKDNSIKDEYSSFSKNIEKVIDIYKYYSELDINQNELVINARLKLHRTEEAIQAEQAEQAEEPKEAKEPEREGVANYTHLFTGSKIKAKGQKIIITAAKQSYKTNLKKDLPQDEYITQYIKQFIVHHNQGDNIGNPPSENLKTFKFTFKPTISGGRKLYHRKRKSSRKRKSRRNNKSTKRKKRHSRKKHSKRRHSRKK